MRVDLLARRWGSPDGATDGMAMAVAFLAHTLAEQGHDVRAHRADGVPVPWTHPNVKWITRAPVDAPIDWSADLVISVVSPVWKRTAAHAAKAGALSRLVYWHHHGDVPTGGGANLLHAPAVKVPPGWARAVVLPPSSWAADAGGERTGSEILVAGASRMKGGHVAIEVAKLRQSLRFFVLRGRAIPAEVNAWRTAHNAEVAAGAVPPRDFLARARALLLPTRAEVHPLVVCEAVARGIPVVVSDLPGCRAAGGDGAIYLRTGATANEWAEALDRALAMDPVTVHPGPYADLAARAIEALTWPARAAEPPPAQKPRPEPPPRLTPRERVALRLPPEPPPPPPAAMPSPPILDEPPGRIERSGSRPLVVVCADVRTWAWNRKAQQLARHLGDRFEIAIIYQYEKDARPIPVGADLYHTFEVFQCARLPPYLDGEPMTTGMTAHVWPTWEQKFGAGTVRAWASKARAFHANSILLRDEMAAHLRRPVHYCPNGVDETFFRRLRRRASDRRLVVGFVGKPNPRKGADLVKSACVRAGVELRTVERTHRDAFGPEEMREFYQDLHVLCVASDMDGTPNPALEAAACGVAIVSNRIGNMPELLAERGGILIGPQSGPIRKPSVDELVDALRGLTPTHAIEMGEAARAEIERAWTWRELANNYAAMWSDAIGAGARKAA